MEISAEELEYILNAVLEKSKCQHGHSSSNPTGEWSHVPYNDELDKCAHNRLSKYLDLQSNPMHSFLKVNLADICQFSLS